MSSSQEQPGDDRQAGERRRSLSKLLRRTTKVLRPKSMIGIGDVAEARPSEGSSAPATEGAATAATGAAASKVKSSSAPKPAKPAGPPVEVIRSQPTSATAHFQLQEQKARSLFAKYNMQLEPGEWITAAGTGKSDWVEKKIRVRVHRQCHRCQTGFGTTKTCTQCGHTRCTKCPRYPDQRSSNKVDLLAVDSDPKYQPVRKPSDGLTLTKPGKHGSDLVRKNVVQRVRRTCHRCSTLFVGKATQCENCKHQRCPSCPREPPKTGKYPDGYPGDTEETFPLAERTLKNTRMRVRWECHECKTFFRSGERTCKNCKHERCETCQRIPPKKVKREPDPSAVQGLEEKLAAMRVSPAA